MKELRDKVAFITGGASGLGLGMAKAFGREGMKVMIADIEQAALTRAVQELKDSQVRAEGVLCDVSSRGALREAGRLSVIVATPSVTSHRIVEKSIVGPRGRVCCGFLRSLPVAEARSAFDPRGPGGTAEDYPIPASAAVPPFPPSREQPP